MRRAKRQRPRPQNGMHGYRVQCWEDGKYVGIIRTHSEAAMNRARKAWLDGGDIPQ